MSRDLRCFIIQLPCMLRIHNLSFKPHVILLSIPKLSQAHGADVQPVQKNLTLVQFHHTEQGQEQGRLAGAGASYDAHLLSWSNYQAHSIQSIRKAVPVCQHDGAELQPTMLRPRRGQLRFKQEIRDMLLQILSIHPEM